MLYNTTRGMYKDHGTNKSLPSPATNAPRKFPFPQTLHATPAFPPEPEPEPEPTHELRAATTAAPSGLGTRIQTVLSSEDTDDGVLRISIEILVPASPRNWERAAVRYVRVVNGSRGVSLGLLV